MSDPSQYTLLVREALPDGRFVVTNASSADVPKGTAFTCVVAEQGALDGVGNYRVEHRSADTAVFLQVVSIEFFRQSIDSIPKGHHAGVAFEGDDCNVLRTILTHHQKPWQILLRSDAGAQS